MVPVARTTHDDHDHSLSRQHPWLCWPCAGAISLHHWEAPQSPGRARGKEPGAALAVVKRLWANRGLTLGAMDAKCVLPLR